LAKCGMLNSSAVIFLLMLSALTRVFILYIMKIFHLMDRVSCQLYLYYIDNYYQTKIIYFPFLKMFSLVCDSCTGSFIVTFPYIYIYIILQFGSSPHLFSF
jgi:hypothetical protein